MIGYMKLWGDFALADPAFLFLLFLLPLLWFWQRSKLAKPVIVWPGLSGKRLLPVGIRARLAFLPVLLEFIALALMIIALSRPQKITERAETISRGVDIILCLDVSSSMTMPDLDPQEKKRRIDVVKDVANDFLKKRKGDRVGIVTFARFPRVLCPPTLDLEAARAFLKGVDTVKVRVEDGTAIGAGLARAVAMLHKSKASSKVVVLLTDGQETIGQIKPLDAGRAAKEYKVKVYAVAAGRFDYFRGPFGRLIKQPQRLDTSELKEIASITKGLFFRPRDAGALRDAWKKIDKMEKTEIRDIHWVDAKDVVAGLLVWGVVLLLAAFSGAAFILGGLP